MIQEREEDGKAGGTKGGKEGKIGRGYIVYIHRRLSYFERESGGE